MENKITLLDTTFIHDYDSYLEWCEANDVEPKGVDSKDYINYCSEERQLDIEDFFTNIAHAKVWDCVVTGIVGRWNGNFEIEPKRFASLEKAVNACFDGVDDVIVTLENGEIRIEGYHHDGTNKFTVRKLSDMGVAAFEGDVFEDNPCDTETIENIF